MSEDDPKQIPKFPQATGVDLTSCDREPIHIPGAILPHGAMLVLDFETFEILQAAGNTPGLLGAPIDALLGQTVGAWLHPDRIRRLRDLCSEAELIRPRHLLDPILRVVADQPLDASVHRIDGVLVVEFEAADTSDRYAIDPLASIHDMLDYLDAAKSLNEFCQGAAERVRKVTGYDRVMIYRFTDDGSGWVFAESREDRLPPFLDLHYPAADIPRQARALYLKNWLRLITQVDYDPAPLVPADNPRTGRPLDMTFTTLRDVSPIHREYLRNMGVDASMSISIVRDGKLWGLIACHHYTPRRLPRHLRAACELFGSMFSLQLEARERADQFAARLASRKVLQTLMRNLAHEDDYAHGLVHQLLNLLDYIHAGGLSLRVASRRGGVAVRINSGITSLGITPNEEQIAALTDWLTTSMEESGNGIFITDRLGEIWQPAQAFADVGSGLLAISVSREPRDFILWFRSEIVETVTWGGDPRKPVEIGPHGDRLTPRKSFEVWQQTVRGRASPWLQSDGDAALDLRGALLEIVLRRIDATMRERAKAYEQARLLMAELDHRVKNILANILALVTQSSRNAGTLTEFTQGLERRVRSMSKAHDLLAASRWQGVSIRGLVSEELDYIAGGARISIVGPEVELTPRAALALSLAIHELATNAVKYGALSAARGRVAVYWELNSAGAIDLSWTEAGGPTVYPPRRRGFGSTLVEQALAMETGGRSLIHFNRDGVRCEIVLPASAVSRIAVTEEIAGGSIEHAPAPDKPAGEAPRRILIVEDSALIVMMIKQMLEDMGWEMVGPAMSVAVALAIVREDERLDAALVDVNLNGEMSWDVADALKERRVPFAFSTGYDGDTVLPRQLADAIVISKPYRLEEVARRLRELISNRADKSDS